MSGCKCVWVKEECKMEWFVTEGRTTKKINGFTDEKKRRYTNIKKLKT